MKPGKGTSTWRYINPIRSMGVLFILLAGCVSQRQDVEKQLQGTRFGASHNEGVAENYLIGCPDVLEVRVPSRPNFGGKYAVGVDGRIDLSPTDRVRVEGRTPGEAAAEIAAALSTAPANVAVQVAEYRSQIVVLFGQVVGRQRVVPYEGQETVLDLLQRTGGIARGAAPESIYVVRTHVEDGGRPEIFHVNLPAIVQKNDERTNIRIMPYDQIYVGETRQNYVENLVPPCIRPFYQMLWHTLPEPGARRTPEK